MHGKARDFILEIDRLELAVLHIGAGRIKLKSLTLQIGLGALDEVGLNADMALRPAVPGS